MILRQMLSDTTLRKLQLIEYLDLKTDPIADNQIADDLAISHRTLTHDIQQINTEYDFLHISNTHWGVYLEYSKGANLRSIYRYLLKNEPGFRLLDWIFRHTVPTVEKAAEDLYTSKSTIYRLVNKLNLHLEQYHIQIKYPDLIFEGNEVDIRFFFAQFYSEISEYNEWPFKSIDIDAIKELIISAYSYAEYQLNYPTIRFLLFSVSVNMVRLRQGHHISTETNAFDIMYHEFLETPENLTFMQEITQRLGIEMSLNNIKQLFIAYAKETFESPRIEEHANDESIETVRQSMEFLSRIIGQLSDKYHIPIEDIPELAGYLHNTANLFKWETETFNILYPYMPKFIERTQYYIGDFVTVARELLHEYIEQMELDSSDMMHDLLVYNLITHWPNLFKHLYTDRTRKIHCAVISDDDIHHATFMVDILNMNKRPYVHYHVYTDYDIDPFTLDNSPYDVIITTFPIPRLKYKPVCSIHRFPTEKDLYLIDRTIYKLVNMK